MPEIIYDDYGYPAHLDTGVRCGNHHRGDHVYHNSARAVQACYRIAADELAQQRGEIAAEQGYERYLEDRGYWAARADEDREARMGLI